MTGCASAAGGSSMPRAAGPVPQAHVSASHAASTATPPAQARFLSFNIPNLHYIEDDWRFTSTQRYRLPDGFEIRDALRTVKAMGGRVVRVYALSVRKSSDRPDTPRHVIGPGQFNEAAFATLDQVLEVAAELDIQLIIPFVDNWSYWGGVAEYAAFRNKPRGAFFTDQQVIDDFLLTVDHVIARHNTLNGRDYRDDPAIYAWETGNELGSPDAWVARVAQAIKQRDPSHAVIDGTYGPLIREKSLSDPNVDIVSSHHYGPVARSLQLIEANLRLIRGRKRYIIGEFGLLDAADTENFVTFVRSRPIEGPSVVEFALPQPRRWLLPPPGKASIPSLSLPRICVEPGLRRTAHHESDAATCVRVGQSGRAKSAGS